MYAFIINAVAGGGRAAKVRPIIERFMTARDAPFGIFETASPEEASAVSAEAVAQGRVPVAVGGDGSVHHVFSGLIRAAEALTAPPTLGVVPVGTGNDLARMLAIPTRPEEALAILVRGETRQIDYGTVQWDGPSGSGQRPFINVAGIGLDARSALLAVKLKPYLGNLSYTLSPALSVWTWKCPEARIEAIDGAGSEFSWKGRFFLASVANGKWVGGGITISPEAVIDDRRLDLCLIRAASSLRALTILTQAVRGKHERLPEVDSRQFERMTISVSQPAPIHLDGEPCVRDATTAHFSISAGRLRVAAPVDATAAETM